MSTSEVPATTIVAVCRTWEAVLEAKYPGTRWHVYPRAEGKGENVDPGVEPSEPLELADLPAH